MIHNVVAQLETLLNRAKKYNEKIEVKYIRQRDFFAEIKHHTQGSTLETVIEYSNAQWFYHGEPVSEFAVEMNLKMMIDRISYEVV